jgi:hypothetical protein
MGCVQGKAQLSMDGLDLSIVDHLADGFVLSLSNPDVLTMFFTRRVGKNI